jgi:hypothetical protein
MAAAAAAQPRSSLSAATYHLVLNVGRIYRADPGHWCWRLAYRLDYVAEWSVAANRPLITTAWQSLADYAGGLRWRTTLADYKDAPMWPRDEFPDLCAAATPAVF